MTITQTKEQADRLIADVNAAQWILSHADGIGPLAHLPTHDPAVRVLMSARRHLLNDARKARTLLGW